MKQLAARVLGRWRSLGIVSSLAFIPACAGASSGSVTPSHERCTDSSRRWQGRVLLFEDMQRITPGIAAGSYRLEVTGESYAAECDFLVRAAEGWSDSWEATCRGDDLELHAFFETVLGFRVPARLTKIEVRLVRDRALLFDAVVSERSSGCKSTHPIAPPEGFCIVMERAGAR